MILLPEASSAYIDPFYDETTLVLTCDVIEPSDGKGYDRDPRSIAKRAEAYLKSSGVATRRSSAPNPNSSSSTRSSGRSTCPASHSKILSEEAAWSTADKFEGGNTGHRPRIKGGYFPVPPSTASTTSAPQCAWRSKPQACRSKCTTTKWRTPASAKSEPSSAP